MKVKCETNFNRIYGLISLTIISIDVECQSTQNRVVMTMTEGVQPLFVRWQRPDRFLPVFWHISHHFNDVSELFCVLRLNCKLS